jgi:hypothetical protein
MAKKISAQFQKRAGSTLDYKVDWATWLSTDTISTSSWTVPTGLTKASESNTTTSATVWVSGGTIGTTYEIINTIITAAGRTDYRTVTITIIE